MHEYYVGQVWERCRSRNARNGWKILKTCRRNSTKIPLWRDSDTFSYTLSLLVSFSYYFNVVIIPKKWRRPAFKRLTMIQGKLLYCTLEKKVYVHVWVERREWLTRVLVSIIALHATQGRMQRIQQGLELMRPVSWKPKNNRIMNGLSDSISSSYVSIVQYQRDNTVASRRE